MLTIDENTEEHNAENRTPQLNENFIEQLLLNSNKQNLINFIEAVKSRNTLDLESVTANDTLKFSPKIAKELTSFFDEISKNFDALFYKKCQSDNFLPEFYKAIKLALTRLKSGSDLKPELRLELQPSAYSGFDDKLAKQDFANIFFAIALANYASNKSQGKIEEGKFIDVLKLMDEQKIKQEEEILRMPKSKAVIPYPNAFLYSTFLLNFLMFGTQLGRFCYIAVNDNSKIDKAIDKRDFLRETYKNSPSYLASELAVYHVTEPEITEMKKHFVGTMAIQGLEMGESGLRSSVDAIFGLRGNPPNTNFLLFATSLIFASEYFAENFNNNNFVKSFSTQDEPISVDNRLLVDGIRFALFVASKFDRRFGIDHIADRMIGGLSWGFSSLGTGLVNCAKSLFKSREGQDLESGLPLIENINISPDQIKALAKEFSKLLAISTSTPELRASTPTPPLELRASTPPSEVRLPRFDSAVETLKYNYK